MRASENPWYKARIEASKYDDRLKSREGAAELLGMSVSSVADTELGLLKVMPVDKAILMADLYKAPQLINHYCLNECPIGCRHSISEELCDIDRITVKLMKMLSSKTVEIVKDKLLDIAEDGRINSWELDDFNKIVEFFDTLAKDVSELKLLADSIRSRNEEE